MAIQYTKSEEDYLESIYVLSLKAESVKSIDVANDLNVSKPAVNIAMKDLIAKGLVEKENYGKIHLTEKGMQIGKYTYAKHNLLKKALIHIGVDEETADKDCCMIEHAISPKTFEYIKKYLKQHGIK